MTNDSIFNGLGNTPIKRLLVLMSRLRDPQTGCPWDIQQTYDTIAPYTIEEAYEVSQAIDNGNMDELEEELGDLLLQVIFQAQIGVENGDFDFGSICDGIVTKMVSRHPHVFGEPKQLSPAEQTIAWEELKEKERSKKTTKDTEGKNSILDGVALALPALMRAEKLQKRAARVGFDWPDYGPVLNKINEEAEEVAQAKSDNEPQSRIHEEVGDLIFSAVNLARKLGVDPEHALRDANQKFTKRFQYIEQHAEDKLQNLKLEELENLWVAAKKHEV